MSSLDLSVLAPCACHSLFTHSKRQQILWLLCPCLPPLGVCLCLLHLSTALWNSLSSFLVNQASGYFLEICLGKSRKTLGHVNQLPLIYCTWRRKFSSLMFIFRVPSTCLFFLCFFCEDPLNKPLTHVDVLLEPIPNSQYCAFFLCG